MSYLKDWIKLQIVTKYNQNRFRSFGVRKHNVTRDLYIYIYIYIYIYQMTLPHFALAQFGSVLLSKLLKLQKIVLMSRRQAASYTQCQCTRILLPLTNHMAMRTQHGFKRHQSRYSCQCSRKTTVSTLLSVNIFTGRPSFMGARSAHKLHHGCYYSYHRVLNSKIMIRH